MAVKSRIERKRPKEARSKTDTGRLKLVAVALVFAVIWVLLWGRAAYVQLYLGPKLSAAAGKQNLATEFEVGERGRIYASNNALLATSVESKSVYASPVEIQNPAQTAQTLSQILGGSRKNLVHELASSKGFVWVKRQIEDTEAQAIQKANLPGIHLTSEYRRMYPNRHLGGQVLGFVDVDGKGLEGIESIFDDRMAGGRAKFVVQRDAAGRRLYLDAQGKEMNIRGQDVRLTIDTVVQDAAEQALSEAVTKFNGRSGMAIVVRVETGDILALAHYPFFNSNSPSEYKAAARRNRAALDIFEPGSTMKPFTFASALEQKVIDPNKIFDCENGRWNLRGKTIRDTHPYRWLSANRVLRYSSNIGTAKIGLSLGAQPFSSYLHKLGFGEKPGLLQNESSGILRQPKEWSEFDLAAISFGQGIGVTGLQMAKAYLTLANKGVTKPLRLVIDPPVEETPEPERIFSSQTAETVLSMMREVVEEDGTGKLARIPGVPMAGKTGTAQKVSSGKGYGEGIVASFVGLVPADKPEFLFMVAVDEPTPVTSGGVVAAPAVRDIAIKTLSYFGRLPEAKGAPQAEGTEHSMTAKATHPPTAEGGGATVPNLVGLSVRRALEVLGKHGVVPSLKGNGMEISNQKPAPGEPWPGGAEAGGGEGFILWLGHADKEKRQ
jgi:cell division protein FtsI (penicillin-binding protein 3)